MATVNDSDPPPETSADDLSAMLIERVLNAGDARLSEPPFRAIVERLCRRMARRLTAGGTVDEAALARAALAIAEEALDRGNRAEARRLVEERGQEQGWDPTIVGDLLSILDSYGNDLGIDDPARWVGTWYRAEVERRRAPDGIRDPGLRDQMRMLHDLIYRDDRLDAYLRQLTRAWVDPDDVRQGVAKKIFQRFVKADRFGLRGPLVHEGRETAYVRTALRNEYIDLLGRNRETPVGSFGEEFGQKFAQMAGESSSEEEAIADRLDLRTLVRQVIDRSHAAPGTLGPLYHAQWLQIRNGQARRSVARRFAVASLITAWQRRSDGLLSLGMVDGLTVPVASDDAIWLRRPVNRALGMLIEGWGERYGERLPADRATAAGVRGATEASDYIFLIRECRGQADSRQQDDLHGERSVRRYGVGALVRAVYADLVTDSDGKVS